MWRIIIIGLILLFLFGGKRMGAIGKGLGDAIRNFKRGIADPVPPATPPLQVTAPQPPSPGTSQPRAGDEPRLLTGTVVAPAAHAGPQSPSPDEPSPDEPPPDQKKEQI